MLLKSSFWKIESEPKVFAQIPVEFRPIEPDNSMIDMDSSRQYIPMKTSNGVECH